MTTPIVASITDEQLAELELVVSQAEDDYPMKKLFMALIARLRAAEKDAARYRWLRKGSENLKSRYWLPSVKSSGFQDIDDAVDTAMEKKP